MCTLQVFSEFAITICFVFQVYLAKDIHTNREYASKYHFKLVQVNTHYRKRKKTA